MAGGGRDLPAHDLGLRRAKGRSTSKRSIFASKSSVVIVSSPTLACSRSISASRASAGRLFSDASPPARNWSRQPLSSAAVTPSSRETSSRSSPRRSRSTVSCLRRADIRRRGSGVGPSPPAWWPRSAGPTPTPTLSSILTSLQLPTCKAVSQRTVGRGIVAELSGLAAGQEDRLESTREEPVLDRIQDLREIGKDAIPRPFGDVLADQNTAAEVRRLSGGNRLCQLLQVLVLGVE